MKEVSKIHSGFQEMCQIWDHYHDEAREAMGTGRIAMPSEMLEKPRAEPGGADSQGKQRLRDHRKLRMHSQKQAGQKPSFHADQEKSGKSRLVYQNHIPWRGRTQAEQRPLT